MLVSHESDFDIDFIQHVSILEENIQMNATNHVDGGASVRKRGPFLLSVVRLPRVSVVRVRAINVEGSVLVIQCSCKLRGFSLGSVAEE